MSDKIKFFLEENKMPNNEAEVKKALEKLPKIA